ncbi:hypothetical protein ABDK56_01705 [Sphingomonas sp. ASV193]|uniref:hypothetical protein n=1 Tax=Sphingomonas sp. ASV193 TaxID=3144405 RepID=UPI0032E8FE38
MPDPRLDAYVRARTADAIGDDRQAAQLYAQLATLDPRNPDIADRAVTSAISAGAFDLAVTTARAMPVASLNLDARLLLVADSLRRGRTADALALVNEGTPDRDGGFIAPLLRAWAETEAKHDGQRYLTASSVVQSMVAPFLPEQRAYLYLAAGDTASAKPLIAQALARDTGRNSEMRLAFADGLRRANDPAGATVLLKAGPATLARFANGTAIPPGATVRTAADAYGALLTGLAIALNQSSDKSLPIALTRVAQHARPQSGATAVLLALLLDSADRRADALQQLATVSNDDPFAPDAREAGVKILGAMGRNADAVALAQRGIREAGRAVSPDDYARLGAAYDTAGDHAASADAYGRAAALADAAGADNRWTYRLLRADQLSDLKRWPETKAELLAGLAAKPDEPLLLNFLGYGELEHNENLDSAEAMIRKAAALRPDDASIADSLGWALFKRGKLDEAIGILSAAAAADPAQGDIQEHLGDVLYTRGRRMEARFAWRAAEITADAEQKVRIGQKIDLGLTPATAAP